MSVAVTHGRTAASVAARRAPPPKKHVETPPPIAVSDIATWVRQSQRNSPEMRLTEPATMTTPKT